MNNLPRGKNEAYWAGYNESAARSAVKAASRAALDAHPNLPDLAHEVARQLGRDNGRKQRIFNRSPHVFAGMDAEELGQASSHEMAMRELRELGHDPGEHDPVAILDAHHAGRKFARDQLANIGSVKGGAASFNRLKGGAGGASDGGKRSGMDSNRANSVIDKFLNNDT